MLSCLYYIRPEVVQSQETKVAFISDRHVSNVLL